MKDVDRFDDQLVSLLKVDGRASFSFLAKRLGIPRAVVAKRVSDLLGSGALRLAAAVDPRILGLNALAHISIRLDGRAAPVVDTLVALDAAAFVSLTTGQYGVVAELRFATMIELHHCLDTIRAIPEVGDIKVLIYQDVLRSFFLGEAPNLPDLVLDAIDLRLIGELQADGRLSFGELGRSVGLSVSAARSRVYRLRDTHVLQIGAIRGRDQASKGVTLGFGITTAGNAPEVIEAVNRAPGVEFIARCFGDYDLVMTIASSDLFAATPLIDTIRSLERVKTVTVWAHLRILKEHYDMSLDRLPTLFPPASRSHQKLDKIGDGQ